MLYILSLRILLHIQSLQSKLESGGREGHTDSNLIHKTLEVHFARVVWWSVGAELNSGLRSEWEVKKCEYIINFLEACLRRRGRKERGQQLKGHMVLRKWNMLECV